MKRKINSLGIGESTFWSNPPFCSVMVRQMIEKNGRKFDISYNECGFNGGYTITRTA